MIHGNDSSKVLINFTTAFQDQEHGSRRAHHSIATSEASQAEFERLMVSRGFRDAEPSSAACIVNTLCEGQTG